MKAVFLILTVIAIANTDDIIENRKQINSNAIIRQLFELLKYFIKNGSDADGLLTIDPIQFDYKYYDLNLPNKLLSLHVAFNNGVITGLSHFDEQHTLLIKNEIAIELCVNFPLISFYSENYKISGNIYEIIPLIGKGNFALEIHNLTLSGKVFLKKSDDERSILIENILYPKFSIQEIISHVEFDNNIDDIANFIIKDLLAEYLTRFNQYIAKNYIQIFIDTINPFLNIFDSWRLLASVLYDYDE